MEVLGGGGRERPMKQWATGREKPFSFSNQLLHFSLDTICLRVQRERERACARSFSSWTTFFPVAKEQEMVEEVVDDARNVC